MKKTLFTFILLCLLSASGTTNAQNWLWAKGTAYLCTGQSEGNAITIDKANNVYVGGHFGDSLYLGGYTFFYPFLSMVPSIWQSFFAKYDTAGNLLWVKTPVAGLAQTWGVKIGPDNCLYAMGTYNSTTLSFGGSTFITAPDPAPIHYFIAKFDTAGNAIWLKSIGEGFYAFSFNYWIAANIDCDKWGGIYITSDFVGPVLHVGSTALVNRGIENVWVAKFDTGGNVKWAKSFGGGREDAPHALAVSEAGSVYVTGYYSSPAFYASPMYTLNLTSMSGGTVDNAFLMKLDTGGNVLWARSARNGSDALAIAVDQQDNAVIGGVMEEKLVSFGAYTVFDPLTALYAHGTFLAKYDPNGNAIWANAYYSDTWSTDIFSLKTDYCNNIWAAGSWGDGSGMSSAHTLYYDLYTHVTVGSSGPDPMFLMHVDATGGLMDHQEFTDGFKTAMDCNSLGDVMLTGKYLGPLSFGADALLPGNYLFFLAKYRPAKIGPYPISGPEHLCQGSSATLSDASTGGIWTSSDLSIAQVIASTGVVKGMLAGTANISYTLSNGCSSAITPFVVDAPVPASINLTQTLLDGSRAPDTICLGTPVKFRTNPMNAGPVPFFAWYRFDTLKASGFDTLADGNDSFIYSPIHGDVIFCRMVVDGVCAVSDTVNDFAVFNVDSNKSPSIAITKFTAPDTVDYPGEVITFYSTVLDGGNSPSYQWYRNSIAIPGATRAFYATPVYVNDTFYCEVTGNPPCGISPSSSTSNKILVFSHVGVDVISKATSDLSLYPNPNKGIITLSGKTQAAAISMSVRDLLGRVVYRGDAVSVNGTVQAQINLGDNIASGAYLLQVNSGFESQVYQFEIVK